MSDDNSALWAAYAAEEEELSHDTNAAFCVRAAIAAASMLGSICIVMETHADWRQSRATTVTRILFLLHSLNVLGMFGSMLHTIPAPKELPERLQSKGLLGPRGSLTSCSIQGFLFQIAIQGVLLWDACLSMTYVMIIRWNWPDAKLVRFEKWAHAFIWTFVLVTSIVPLVGKMYNYNGNICYM